MIFEPVVNYNSMTLTYILKHINKLDDSPVVYVKEYKNPDCFYISKYLENYRVFYSPFIYKRLAVKII